MVGARDFDGGNGALHRDAGGRGVFELSDCQARGRSVGAHVVEPVAIGLISRVAVRNVYPLLHAAAAEKGLY